MSTPAKVEHEVEEEGRGTGTTPVKVGRVAQEERGWVVRVAESSSEGRGPGTSPVKVASRVEKERGPRPRRR
jgi:hypothetical protein